MEVTQRRKEDLEGAIEYVAAGGISVGNRTRKKNNHPDSTKMN